MANTIYLYAYAKSVFRKLCSPDYISPLI